MRRYAFFFFISIFFFLVFFLDLKIAFPALSIFIFVFSLFLLVIKFKFKNFFLIGIVYSLLSFPLFFIVNYQIIENAKKEADIIIGKANAYKEKNKIYPTHIEKEIVFPDRKILYHLSEKKGIYHITIFPYFGYSKLVYSSYSEEWVEWD